MPPPDREEPFQQAESLINQPSPPQANLRRAISAAYYGLFHTVALAAADMLSVKATDQPIDTTWYIEARTQSPGPTLQEQRARNNLGQ